MSSLEMGLGTNREHPDCVKHESIPLMLTYAETSDIMIALSEKMRDDQTIYASAQVAAIMRDPDEEQQFLISELGKQIRSEKQLIDRLKVEMTSVWQAMPEEQRMVEEVYHAPRYAKEETTQKDSTTSPTRPTLLD